MSGWEDEERAEEDGASRAKEKEGETEAVVDGRRKGSNEIGEKERERNGREDILSLSLAS